MTQDKVVCATHASVRIADATRKASLSFLVFWFVASFAGAVEPIKPITPIKSITPIIPVTPIKTGTSMVTIGGPSTTTTLPGPAMAGPTVAAITAVGANFKTGSPGLFSVSGFGASCGARVEYGDGLGDSIGGFTPSAPPPLSHVYAKAGTYEVEIKGASVGPTQPCAGNPKTMVTVAVPQILDTAGTVVTRASAATALAAIIPKLQVADAFGVYGATVKLRAVAKNPDDSPLLNSKVTFKVGGSNVGIAMTGSDGAAQIDYTVAESLPAGSNAVHAESGGVTATGKLGVLKGATNLSLEVQLALPGAFAADVGSQVTFRGYLQIKGGSNDIGVKGRTVKFKVNGKAAGSATSGDQGLFMAKYKVPVGALGDQSVEVLFDGDNQYLPSAIGSPQHFIAVAAGSTLPRIVSTPKQTFVGQFKMPDPVITTPKQYFTGQY